MILSKSILKAIAIELRTKTDKQLERLLETYSSQLTKLTNENNEYISNALMQKISLVEQEINLRKQNTMNY